MFLFSKPDPTAIRSFLTTQRDRPFSYAQVGASRGGATVGYAVDHNRVQLGHGIGVFERAVGALRRWQMFNIPWIELCWPSTPIERGAAVGVLVSHMGFWSLNACRIVYVLEERGIIHRFGFAYGTLLEHAEQGEERFTVEFRTDDQSVWYDLYAFSRPRSPLARLARPYARKLQERFARDSKLAMKIAAEDPTGNSGARPG